MKKKIAVFLSLCLTVASAPMSVFAGEAEQADSQIEAMATSGNYEYEDLADGTIQITYYSGEEADVTFPAKLDEKTVSSVGYIDEDGYGYQVLPTEELTYQGDDGETYTDYYNQTVQSVVIEEGIKSIEDYAFYYTEYLSSLTLPSTLETIGNYAFEYDYMLESFEFPASLKSIGDYAFDCCTALTEAVLPEGLQTIGDYAFYYCSLLNSVTIPASVTSIGTDAFTSCAEDLTLHVTSGSAAEQYAKDNGISYTVNGEEPEPEPAAEYEYLDLGDGTIQITKYNGSDSEVIVPAQIDGKTVVSIGSEDGSSPVFATVWSDEEQYYVNDTMTSVEIPEGVTSIGAYAFDSCVALNKVKLPSTLTTLGEGAFYYCYMLTSIVIPESVTTMADWVFAYNYNLAAIVLPKNLESMGSDVFYDCTDFVTAWVYENSYAQTYVEGYSIAYELLDAQTVSDDYIYQELEDGTIQINRYLGTGSELEIPAQLEEKTVSTIADEAFSYCYTLTTVTLPAGLTNLGNYVFSGASGLTEFVVADENTAYVSYEGCVYDKDQKTLVAVPGAKTEVTFAEGVTTIGEGAFSDGALASVSIPESVTSIGDYAFYYCVNLASVDIPKSVETIGTDAFAQCSTELVLKVYAKSAALQYAKDNGLTYQVVDAKDITGCEVTLAEDSYVYDGTAKTPEVTVKDGDVTLVSGTDYTLSYSDNMNVGTATVTVKGMDSYTNSKTAEFTITAADLSDYKVTLSRDKYAYDGTEKKPEVTVKNGDIVLTEGTDYTVAYSDNVKEGTATVTVSGTGNYSGSASAQFVIKEAIAYTDVEKTWYYNAVEYVTLEEIMTGMNKTTFGPYNTIVRAQFAMTLFRLSEEKAVDYKPVFPDVQEGQWFTDAVLWANSVGVIKGYTNTGLFGTNDKISRQDIAVMMYRYAKDYKQYEANETADLSSYTDADQVTAYAKDAMSWAVGSGIITGKNNETELDPQGTASRAECAVILQRFMEKYQEEK